MRYSDGKHYRSYDSYLKETFGSKTVRLPLDGGFTCPNLDGTKGYGGCRYCTKEPLRYRGLPLWEQAEEAKRSLGKWLHRGEPERYIAYFQVFSNTYAPTEVLEERYREALSLPGVVGLTIATRCDCLPDSTVALLRRLDTETHLTVELGLQTANDRTAIRIGRGHTTKEFLDGYRKLEGLRCGIHLINGLPGEDREEMLATARFVASLSPHMVKIHMLYLEQGTAMTEAYIKEPFPLLTREEYMETVVDQLELLPSDTVIGRLTGDGNRERLVAPRWTTDKKAVLNGIERVFRERGSWQGKRF
ncbi:MAG: TIGR01212 family radical SAM protein [Ruminococcaceae bacterium]|nr:TIGR01212 family radical SAM protein [Oscillospiraceae bacterium]